jgi:hypothetical protein
MTESNQWDGFTDPYWNLGQVFLWAATRNRDHVDAASDRSGLYDVSYELAAAAVQIDEQVPLADTREEVAEQIRQKALDGKLKAYDCTLTPPKELPPTTWIKLKIDFDSGMPFVRSRDDSGLATACSDLRFFNANVLECFPEKAETSAAMLNGTRNTPPSQKRLRAANAIAEIWPVGTPKPEEVSDKELFNKVSRHLEKKGLEGVGRDTVLRAAGRRK